MLERTFEAPINFQQSYSKLWLLKYQKYFKTFYVLIFLHLVSYAHLYRYTTNQFPYSAKRPLHDPDCGLTFSKDPSYHLSFYPWSSSDLSMLYHGLSNWVVPRLSQYSKHQFKANLSKLYQTAWIAWRSCALEHIVFAQIDWFICDTEWYCAGPLISCLVLSLQVSFG